MNKPLKFLVWFSTIIIAVFVVVWLWILQSSVPGPYDLEPVSVVRSNIRAGNQTAGWQIYRDEGYGLEFKYPQDINFSTGDLDPKESIYLNSYGNDAFSADFYLSIRKKGGARDIIEKQYLNGNLKDYVEWLWEINKSEDKMELNKKIGNINTTFLSNIKGYRFYVSGAFNSNRTSGFILKRPSNFFFFENEKAKFIIYVPVDSQIGNKILSTLKFIELSGWQTYRNERYGFEIKHPADHTPYEKTDQQKEILIPATSTSERVAIAEPEAFLFCCEASVLDIFVVHENVSPQEWLDQNYQKYSAKAEIKSTKNVIFAGENALEIIGGNNIGSTYRLLIIKQLDYLIVANQNSKSEFLNSILSTFRFLP